MVYLFTAGRVEVGEVGADIFYVFVFTGSVGDKIEVVCILKRDNEVIDDTTSDGMEEDRESGLVGFQGEKVRGRDRVEEGKSTGTS